MWKFLRMDGCYSFTKSYKTVSQDTSIPVVRAYEAFVKLLASVVAGICQFVILRFLTGLLSFKGSLLFFTPNNILTECLNILQIIQWVAIANSVFTFNFAARKEPTRTYVHYQYDWVSQSFNGSIKLISWTNLW